MPSSSTNPTDPRSLKCAACGCHRNFHRRDPPEPSTTTTTPTFLNCFYSPSTAAPPPPPPQPLPHRGMSQSTSPSLSSSPSHSPSPMSSPSSPPPLSHVPPPPSSAPHMLLALGNAYSAVPSDQEQHQLHRNSFNNSNNFSPVVLNTHCGGGNHSSKNKRYRTKFSQEQKEKMYKFSEKLGWRMNNKGDDSLVQDFCNDIGVPRGVFKVWMHNNKNTFNKKISSSSSEPPPPPPANNSNLNEALLLPPHDQKINGGGGGGGGGGDGGSNNNKNGDMNGSNNSSVNNVVAHVPITGLSS
ncbi:hypothetical protein PIB30_008763 [Stylosanthes scabra]|uniref:ZF-HD dimerization-type domain-containing protein n=1 Tax=Stylosanthes scabra TaxID=79078 RepID=A0ABU6W4K0_9FABA|nr:hypothetical protein [Stylosanthes scabra]